MGTLNLQGTTSFWKHIAFFLPYTHFFLTKFHFYENICYI